MANLKIVKIILVCVFFGLLTSTVLAYVASSSNYVLQSDSVNFGGGYSTSTSYRSQSTFGEVGSGLYSSTTMIMNGGYQAMEQDYYLAMSFPTGLPMSAVNGSGGGVSNGSSTWHVLTDNVNGYELSVRAETSPALTSGSNFFADYQPSFGNPDYSWNNPDNESRFGFSPEGEDVTTEFLNDSGGVVGCGSGGLDTADACWSGFSTENKVIARSVSNNYPDGASTTLKFRAQVGAKKVQLKGTYQANIIVSALAL